MKRKIGVICGGYSSERKVSLSSGNTVAKALGQAGMEVRTIDVGRDAWVVDDQQELPPFSPESIAGLDAIYNIIHGHPGEDGIIVGFFELMGLPVIGCDTYTGALTFNKWACNQFLSKFGVPVARSIRLEKGDAIDQERILEELGLPLFVKPNQSGSSFGISRVSDPENLMGAIELALSESDVVLMESEMKGREVTCGVYRDSSGIVALPITEIISKGEFFDYSAKYEGESEEITPARLEDKTRQRVWDLAKRIYQLVEANGIIRIDFIIVKGFPHVIEVNTTPGMTDASLIPQQIAVNGELPDVLARVVETELSLRKA